MMKVVSFKNCDREKQQIAFIHTWQSLQRGRASLGLSQILGGPTEANAFQSMKTLCVEAIVGSQPLCFPTEFLVLHALCFYPCS